MNLESCRSSPFTSRGRWLLPPLTTANPLAPSQTLDNQIAGVEKRLLKQVPLPHPSLVRPSNRRLGLFVHHPSLRLPNMYAQARENLSLKDLDRLHEIRAHAEASGHVLEPLAEGGTVAQALAVETLPPCEDAACPFRDHPKLQSLVHQFLRLPEMEWLQMMEPMDWETWLERYPENKRALLRRGKERASLAGLERSDATLRVFMKMETSTRCTDPRNISPRSDVFLSVLGPFISAIERQAKHCPFLVKGRTPAERGALLHQWSSGPIIETDFSRFDMTVSYEVVVAFELAWIRKAFPKGKYPELDAALSLLSRMKGVSDLGVVYDILGTRASGDAHTSLGNGLLNRFIIWACLRKHPLGSWVSHHEGDDGRIALLGLDPQVATHDLSFAKVLGFDLKIVLTDSLHATFCGRWLCPEGHEVADIFRCLDKFPITFKDGDRDALLLAKAYSYRYTDGHSPLISKLVARIIELLEPRITRNALRKRIRGTRLFERQLILGGIAAETREPESCCRVLVAMRTGLSPRAQVEIEKVFAQWNLQTWLQPIHTLSTNVSTDAANCYD